MDIRDILIKAVHTVAAHQEHLPDDWQDYAYKSKQERTRMFSNFPAPTDLRALIREVQEGRPGTHYDILVELILSSQILGSIDNPCQHELWDTAYQLATHEDIAADARKDFLLDCDDCGVYLEDYKIEYILLEESEEGKQCKVQVLVHASGIECASDRGDAMMEKEAPQLATKFGFSGAYFFEQQDITKIRWSGPRPTLHRQPNILEVSDI